MTEDPRLVPPVRARSKKACTTKAKATKLMHLSGQLDCQYRFSIGTPKGSDEYSVGTQGSYKNLRKTLFNVVFGLRRTTSRRTPRAR